MKLSRQRHNQENDYDPEALELEHNQTLALGVKSTLCYATGVDCEFSLTKSEKESGKVKAAEEARAREVQEVHEELLGGPHVEDVSCYRVYDDNAGRWGLGEKPFVRHLSLGILATTPKVY